MGADKMVTYSPSLYMPKYFRRDVHKISLERLVGMMICSSLIILVIELILTLFSSIWTEGWFRN